MLKIAFATSDGSAVDQHFGWCERFDVYEIDAAGARLLATRDLAPSTDEGEGKLQGRLDAVSDCAVLHVTAIGGSAAARVVNSGIMPVRVPDGTPVLELVHRLQAVLDGTPPPWLRKLLRRHDPDAVAVWSPA